MAPKSAPPPIQAAPHVRIRIKVSCNDSQRTMAHHWASSPALTCMLAFMSVSVVVVHFTFDICLSMKLGSVTRVMASVQLLADVVKQDSQALPRRDGESPSPAGAWRCGSQTG